jgi:phospholipase C
MLASVARATLQGIVATALLAAPFAAEGRELRQRRHVQRQHAVPRVAPSRTLPAPEKSGIDHIVVVTMEDRSFDHLLGWLPNADGRQGDLGYPDEQGTMHSTVPLTPDFTGCGEPDPDHSWVGGRIRYGGGAMNGFLLAGGSEDFAIGYYEEDARPFFNSLARAYTTCDRYFSSTLAPTYPNRVFLHAAQTDRLENTLDVSTLPTIWDRLEEKGVSARYYYTDVSFLWLWGPKYLPIHADYSEFLEDAASGNLPAVAFVEPSFLDDATGTSTSDHPVSDIRQGEAFLADVFHAVSTGPGWAHTVLIITYDESGGFFDHVRPPRVVAPNDVDPDIVKGKVLLGMRVPTIVVSPFTRGNPDDPRVSSTIFDHTSILKLIEWRWRLEPLTARDASTDVGNLLSVFDFSRPSVRVPNLPQPNPPAVRPCLPPAPSSEPPLADLRLREPF